MSNDKREKARGNLTAYGYTPWQKLRELRRQRDRFKEIALEALDSWQATAYANSKDYNMHRIAALRKEVSDE